jgi:hypothetical protein
MRLERHCAFFDEALEPGVVIVRALSRTKARVWVDCPLRGAYLCLAENNTGVPRIFRIM